MTAASGPFRAKAAARRLAVRARDRAIAPVMTRLDGMQASTDARLEELSRRVAGVERIIEILDGRAATVTERSVAQGESQARLVRRLEEIEKLLDSPPPEE